MKTIGAFGIATRNELGRTFVSTLLELAVVQRLLYEIEDYVGEGSIG